MTALTAHQIRQIAVEALAHDRTVRRVYNGVPTKSITFERIRLAAARLGLPAPPMANAGDDKAPRAA